MGSKAPNPVPGQKRPGIAKRVANTIKELVHPSQDGFRERVTPKPVDASVFIFECPCGHSHFRHAGYVKTMVPFIRPGDERRVNVESVQVHVCVKCKKAFIWINEQMYDVTDRIDLRAWEKTEKEAHLATGPGGQC